MSMIPFMIDCSVCKRSPGTITLRSRSYHNTTTEFTILCPKCGGSGRVVASVTEKKDTLREWRYLRGMTKKQKTEMKDWIEFEKQLVYAGVKNE